MNNSLHVGLDLGTTSLVALRVCPADGSRRILEIANTQFTFGYDVISRMERAMAGEGALLQEVLVEGVEKLLKGAGCCQYFPSNVQVVVAANPAISYLLTGKPVEDILFPPHRPSENFGSFIPQEETGLSFPIFLFPMVSGYVGGDLVACLYALDNSPPGTLLIDLGTNAEIALKTETGWLATSVAAGPAFEGGDIRCGMRATEGAIADVQLEGERFSLKVVGGGTPRGVCGSGLMSAIAAALDAKLLSADGTLLQTDEIDTNLSRYVVEGDSGRELLLYRDARRSVVLTQHDIRQFQLAKGAVHAGVRCLLERAGITEEQVSEIILTGAFGHGIPHSALKRVALLTRKMVDKVRFTPAGVLDGLQRFLLQNDGPAKLGAFVKTIKAYPLSGTPAFERAFINALNF